MKFYIGTNNKEKIATVEFVLKNIMSTEFKVEGYDVPSGFGDTPIGEETKLGAYNRAKTLSGYPNCDYAVGIESGIVERYGETYEEAWCCIIKDEAEVYGYSSGLKVPNVITNKMKLENLEHFQVLRTDEIKQLLPIKDKKDTWANYSALMISRNISFEEALRNALVQIFSPKESLYYK